jgi:crossover junction endodeoxyribonuclease RusA
VTTLPLTVPELTAAIPGLCHWRQARGDASDVSHEAFHYGSPCPYLVVAAVLAGQPDPRDDVAEWRVDISAVLDAKGRAPLNLNDRMHWAAKAKATSRVKAATRNAVMAAEIPHLDHVHVEMHYRPASNRFRDIDNMVATLKPVIDALHTRDTSENAPVPYDPIVDGDDPRFVTWSPPTLHAWVKGSQPGLWLVMRSTRISGQRAVAGDQEVLAL